MRIFYKTVSLLLFFVLILEQPQISKNRFGQTQAVSTVLKYTHALDREMNKNSSIPVYEIIYNLNGGENHYLNPSGYYEQILPLQFMPASREGYDFAGWYTDSSYKTPITGVRSCKPGNLILFAKWTKRISNSTNIQMYSYNSSNFTNAPEKKLSNMNYRILDKVDIPGMPQSAYLDVYENRTYSVDQCPQGLCVSDDFILVSSYCPSNAETKGCLYVFDKKTGEYLVTFAMAKRSHLGGIAFDGENIWVCHSYYRSIQRIDYDLIYRLASKKPKQTIDITDQSESYRVSNSPSCMTFYQGKLWIATHTQFFKSVMRAYEYTDGHLVEQEEFEIPDKVQGVCFDAAGHIYLSTSFGRDKSSYIKVYESTDALSKRPGSPVECIEMPPCSEELAVAGNELLVLYESGAKKYHEGTDGNGKCRMPLDHLVAISLNSF